MRLACIVFGSDIADFVLLQLYYLNTLNLITIYASPYIYLKISFIGLSSQHSIFLAPNTNSLMIPFATLSLFLLRIPFILLLTLPLRTLCILLLHTSFLIFGPNYAIGTYRKWRKDNKLMNFLFYLLVKFQVIQWFYVLCPSYLFLVILIRIDARSPLQFWCWLYYPSYRQPR